MSANPYERNLDKNDANFVQLTPLSLLRRTAKVHPNRTAIIHGELRRTWLETETRCRRLASALQKRGLGVGDTVALMAPNIPEHIEATLAVPMIGAVLNSVNIRLDARAIAFILNHGEAKLLLTDREFSGVIAEALELAEKKPIVIDIDDALAHGGELIGEATYEDLLAEGDPDFVYTGPDDEWDAITLNYTSGTTGDPKGVVYSHRGAYLNAIGNAITWSLPHYPVHLWTLPMFHCNGWCLPWTITGMAGTHVCLRRVEAKAIFEAIVAHKVTHLSGAPIVMSFLINAPDEVTSALDHPVKMMTAGAAPPAAVIGAIEQLGFEVIHTYGLTEVYGPSVVCEWTPEWNELPADERAKLKGRQGVEYALQERLTVMDPDTMEEVPADGKTIGEIMIRGNIVMKGYLKNPKTTEKSFAGGWFHSGDLAVMHPNNYVEIKDRSKDIIISGGENISSIEVEGVLYKHPAIQAAAVVARPDEKWGETPCAFVELKPGASVEAEDIIQFCRDNLAKFKCPRHVVFVELPKTSTGKIQKFVLRERARQV
ncbi:MAG: acyl-CoA synthetase [Proteobacteria bacterium]|nr:acyl-CoA synthetase [Pseudomonadota bacterium]